MSSKIITDFLRFNLFCLVLLCVLYLILYLASRQFSVVYDTFDIILSALFSQSAERFIKDNTILCIPIAYCVIFVITCFAYSISTLVNFDKTWQSIFALTKDESEVASFSKNFSDVEIALKDIKHEVFKDKQQAALAESRKNDLVMYLAHDLKTPLTSVIGYLSLLDECPELTKEQRAKYIGISLDKAYRLEQLINEFFEITRFNLSSVTIEKNRIDLSMMLMQISDEFYPMLSQKGLRVEVDLKEKIVMLADADKMARVFDNLLKNAVNYCYENSIIRIGARIIENKVVIVFRNQCDEIPKEKLDRLFEKFFRMDSSRASSTGGSGLGLAISKNIVELHGGTLSAKSSPSHTDFTIVMPFVPAPEIETTE